MRLVKASEMKEMDRLAIEGFGMPSSWKPLPGEPVGCFLLTSLRLPIAVCSFSAVEGTMEGTVM